ncbi:DUF4192 domain-containing protein [Corynebacterium callunae]|uniref:DUF4192 domain-containing protein n=1 Tax=Corynebacterium callunae TaxID=1721 RepID=UPI003981F3CE
MSDKQAQSPQPSTLKTPGELLANVPGILGFYPAESLVFITLFHQDHATRFDLGPVLRIDIEHPHLLQEVKRTLTHLNPDITFCFIISTNQPLDKIEEIAEELFKLGDNNSKEIIGCWFTKAIFSGEPYQLVFGPTEEALGVCDYGMSEWESGTISPIMAAIATSKMLENGQLPEATRSDAYSVFESGNGFLADDVISSLLDRVKSMGLEIEEAIESDHTGGAYEAALEQFNELVLQLSIKQDSITAEKIMQSPEILRDGGVFVARILLRDSILHHCVDSPRVCAPLFLAIGRTFGGEIRANALCLYALSVISMDLGMKAIPALDAAIREVPSHNLSQLLRQGMVEGYSQGLIDACLKGNRAVRKQFSAAPGKKTKAKKPQQKKSAEAA